MQEARTNVNISTLTIFKIVAVLLILYFLYVIKDILAILFISLVLASALDPWVDWLQKKKIPRVLGIALIYFLIILAITFVIRLVIPPIVDELKQLARDFPIYLEKFTLSMSVLREYTLEHGILENVKETLLNFSSKIENAAGSLFSTVTGFISGFISFVLIMVITFYMVVEENAVKKIVWSIAPEEHQPYIMQLVNRMQDKIGLWLRGQIILSVIIFLLTYLGLSILGVKYALVLALVAGLTEFVPYLGPILAAIPAVFFAFTQDPMLAVFVIVLYYIIQLFENNFIVPQLMQKVVGLNPVVSIVVLLIGFKVGGIIGVILAIPVATAIGVFAKDIFQKRMSLKK
jgi:predicted PurR-regulated permease PerM